MIAWFTPQALVLGLSGVFLTIMVEWDGRASYLFPSNISYRIRSISESRGVYPIYFEIVF